jgi:hypothetical protein
LVEEGVHPQEGITELANRAETLIAKYNPLKVVMDTGGLGKKIAEEIRKRRAIPIVAAEKSRKQEFIELLNDAMRTKRFFAKCGSRFATDTHLVEWDYDKTTSERKVIKDEPHSDICDAVLYSFRDALLWLSQPATIKLDLRKRDDWLKWQTEQMEKRLEESVERDQQQKEMSGMDIGEFPALDPWRDK